MLILNKTITSLLLASTLSGCISLTDVATAPIREGEKLAPVPKFNTGERIVFIGDSITHGGSYHKNIFLFNATRYPNKKLRYYNAGVSGDTAAGTIERFDEDVTRHQPSIATIMLGMNDSESWLYEQAPVTATEQAKFLTEQSQIRGKYLANMNTLAESLTALNSQIIFIKPSIYDDTAQLPKTSLIGKNAELIHYGKEIEQLAKKHQATIVDFQTPLLKVNKSLQAQDPKASVIGADRVHPAEQGHFVMAYSFLSAQAESQYVSNFQIDAKAKQLNTFTQCDLTQAVTITSRSVDFWCQGKTLPFPVEVGQQEAAKWVPFQAELNQQFYQVAGLEKGLYQLTIDDTIVGKYSYQTLAKGINLAANRKTPMYQQALKVKALNDQRAQLSAQIRTVIHVHYRMLKNYPNVDKTDLVQVKSALASHVESAKGKPWYG
ncbi:MAG: GDSL-type esterase/lipase family protein [Thalassotalea sp.]